MTAAIPTVDLRDFGTKAHDHFVEGLGRGLERWGFVNVVGHGVDPQLVEATYASARKAFALPAEVKLCYETPHDGRQRGYTGYGIEHARDHAVPDLKEFWHVGRVLPSQHPLSLSGDIPPNVSPAEVPEFAPTVDALFDSMDAVATKLLRAIAEHLDWAVDHFEPIVKDGNSVLRIIHYPDFRAPEPGAVRAAAHEDINLITLLNAATGPGLQILDKHGNWLGIEAPPGAIVVDTGDMMKLLTGGRLGATTHRVINPERSDGGRMSMPMFVHPHPDAELQPGMTARDYFELRQVETGVYHDGRTATEEF